MCIYIYIYLSLSAVDPFDVVLCLCVLFRANNYRCFKKLISVVVIVVIIVIIISVLFIVAGDVIQAEVQLILASEPALTVDECTDRCDAEFNLAVEHSEKTSDHQCRSACFQYVFLQSASVSSSPVL